MIIILKNKTLEEIVKTKMLTTRMAYSSPGIFSSALTISIPITQTICITAKMMHTTHSFKKQIEAGIDMFGNFEKIRAPLFYF